MKEIDVQWLVKAEAENHGAYLWRNNTGGTYDKTGRFIRYGLCVGSSDLIGLLPDGKFLAIEVKLPGKKPTENQQKFLNWINEKGGISFVATSKEDVKKKLTVHGYSSIVVDNKKGKET